jgi:D-serine deaminase-like pyridoxal phosphate-dependent protein
VALHKERNEIVIYGGGVHFSKDVININETLVFGQAVEKTDNGWGNHIPGMIVKKLSQEHGIIHIPENLIDKYKVGDLLYILPVHSCMTADIYSSYLTIKGKIIPRL